MLQSYLGYFSFHPVLSRYELFAPLALDNSLFFAAVGELSCSGTAWSSTMLPSLRKESGNNNRLYKTNSFRKLIFIKVFSTSSTDNFAFDLDVVSIYNYIRVAREKNLGTTKIEFL